MSFLGRPSSLQYIICANPGSVPWMHAEQVQRAKHLCVHVSVLLRYQIWRHRKPPLGNAAPLHPLHRILATYAPPFPRVHTSIGLHSGKGCWEKHADFSGPSFCGHGDEVGRDADVPMGLCSWEVRPSVFFISDVLVWMFFPSVYVSLVCVHVPFYYSCFIVDFRLKKNLFFRVACRVFLVFPS